MTPPDREDAVYFDSPAAWGDWLRANAATAESLWVGFHKVRRGQPTRLSWPESVDEALCWGWIDGLRQRVDDARYRIRFTPRRPGSIWSAVNLAKIEALQAQGRLQPAGLAVFAQRQPERSQVYSHDRVTEPELAAEAQQRFEAHAAAWAYFQSCPPGYRRRLLHWISSAKQAATRARRLDQLIAACERGERMG